MAGNILSHRSGTYHFLNATSLDLGHVKNDILSKAVLVQPSISRPRSLPYGFESSLQPIEGTLITYCKSSKT